jgi:hypothetical protein
MGKTPENHGSIWTPAQARASTLAVSLKRTNQSPYSTKKK